MNARVVPFLLLAAACETPVETVVVPFPTGWKVGHELDLGAGLGTMEAWIPTDENIEDWSEIISIQLLEELQGRRVDELVAQIFADQKARYAHVDTAVIEEDEWSVLYELFQHDSPPHPDQHEVARMIEGNMGIHRVSYLRKGPRMSDEEREIWVGLLRRSFVEVKGEPLR